MFLYVRGKTGEKKIGIDTSMTGTKLADGRSPDGLKGGGGEGSNFEIGGRV